MPPSAMGCFCSSCLSPSSSCALEKLIPTEVFLSRIFLCRVRRQRCFSRSWAPNKAEVKTSAGKWGNGDFFDANLFPQNCFSIKLVLRSDLSTDEAKEAEPC